MADRDETSAFTEAGEQTSADNVHDQGVYDGIGSKKWLSTSTVVYNCRLLTPL